MTFVGYKSNQLTLTVGDSFQPGFNPAFRIKTKSYVTPNNVGQFTDAFKFRLLRLTDREILHEGKLSDLSSLPLLFKHSDPPVARHNKHGTKKTEDLQRAKYTYAIVGDT